MVVVETTDKAFVIILSHSSSISILKARIWSVLLLFSSFYYSVGSIYNNADPPPFVDGGNGYGKVEKLQSNFFLRNVNSEEIDVSATISSSSQPATTLLSEHERKLAAGARLIVRYNSNRGYRLAIDCASEIIADINEPIRYSKGDGMYDDIGGKERYNYGSEGVLDNNYSPEDHTGEIIFIADEDCMLSLQRQRRDVLWVDYDHPTKPLEDGENNFLEWWLSYLTSGEGKSRNNVANQWERTLQEYSEWGMSLIQANEVNKGDRDTKICIVDTGINRGHPFFDGVSISGNDSERWPWDRDNNGHGTQIAGIIASFSKYVTGGRGRIQLHITRGSGDDGDGYEFDLYIAIQQCIEAGVDIINVSIGSTGLSSMNDSLYKRVVNEHGILLIAAAGNDGDETKHFPAAHSASIAVSSVNKKGEWSSFSNNGPWIELAAPGAGIKGPTFEDSYASRSGTSFASPFVAGASAILRTHYDPKICPSVALRYALAINAVVPGAPITGINGNNMKPLDQFPGITSRYESFDSIASSVHGDQYVEGKCNNQYGNGLVKTRDTLDWLRYYDCFRPILSMIQDIKDKNIASSRTIPIESVFASVGSSEEDERNEDQSWFPINQGAKNVDDERGDEDFVYESASLTWAPINQRFLDDDFKRPVNQIIYKDTIDGKAPINQRFLDDDFERPVNQIIYKDTINGSGSESRDDNVSELVYVASLQKMLPWYDRNGGACYSG